MELVTCKAPVNIAVIKYWGKRDESLILPLNDSISVTLNGDLMNSKTTIAASANFKNNKFWLNGREESFSNARMENCVNEVQNLAELSKNPKINEMAKWKIHVCSVNNFPTAAGLASSAAGYACLVYALGKLYQIEDDLSKIARRGSGSACRSIYGGFVLWKMGEKSNGADSVAKQIAPSSHWKEMRVVILVIHSGRKPIGSSIAMKRSVETSDYLKNVAVNERVEAMIHAILNKDFASFAEITMKDSNRLHSICLDTYPPVQYLNDISKFVIQLVHNINEYYGTPKVAYSFDAGPNACLFLLEDSVPLILSAVDYYIPPPTPKNDSYFKGKEIELSPLPPDMLQKIALNPLQPGALSGIIHTEIGDGPVVLEQGHLLNEHGLPKEL